MQGVDFKGTWQCCMAVNDSTHSSILRPVTFKEDHENKETRRREEHMDMRPGSWDA